MSSFLLTWNPSLWDWDEDDIAETVDLTAIGEEVEGRWSTGSRRTGIQPGHRAYLVRQHDERGLVGAGVFTSSVYQDEHWDGSGRDANYANVLWDTMVWANDRLPIEVLKAEVPEVPWDNLQGSGVQVPSAAESALEQLWRDHLEAIGLEGQWLAEEIPRQGGYLEGSATTVLVNRYERSAAARQACIEHWGTACVVCGFDFGMHYPRIGNGFIHVHHLKELSDLGEAYEVDPVSDLRPVCPNCHAMLHQRRPAYTIAEMCDVHRRL